MSMFVRTVCVGVASAALSGVSQASFAPLFEVEPNNTPAEAMDFQFDDFQVGSIAVDGSVTDYRADGSLDVFDWYAVDLFELDQLTVSIFTLDQDAGLNALVFTDLPASNDLDGLIAEADGLSLSVGENLPPLFTFNTPVGDFDVRETSHDFVADENTRAYVLVYGGFGTTPQPAPDVPANYKLVLGYNPGPNVPTPGSMALVAIAGLAAIRRGR